MLLWSLRERGSEQVPGGPLNQPRGGQARARQGPLASEGAGEDPVCSQGGSWKPPPPPVTLGALRDHCLQPPLLWLCKLRTRGGLGLPAGTQAGPVARTPLAIPPHSEDNRPLPGLISGACPWVSPPHHPGCALRHHLGCALPPPATQSRAWTPQPACRGLGDGCTFSLA